MAAPRTSKFNNKYTKKYIKDASVNTDEKTKTEQVKPANTDVSDTEKIVEGSANKSPIEHEVSPEQFVKETQASMNQEDIPHLEIGANKIEDDPILQLKAENEYTTEGIKNEANKEDSAADNETAGHQKRNVETNNNLDAKDNSGVNDISDDFEAEPPPSDDEAKKQTISSGEPKKIIDPMGLPPQKAEELVDWGFAVLNFGVGKFGGYIVDIPIKTEYFRIKGLVASTLEHNINNIEKLKFQPDEIEMVKKPLVKVLNEKGIEGFSSMEQLMIAIAMVMASRIKAFMEIRDLNKKFTENTVGLIKQSEEGIRKEMKDMGERIKKEMQAEMEEKISGNKSKSEVDSEGFTDAEVITVK